LDSVLEKTNTLVVRVVDFQKSKPIQNVKVKVLKIEKSVTQKQWAENLKNGSPFKSLVLSMNTDNNGAVTVQLPVGTYEAEIEKYGFNRVCELTQNVEVLVIEPKKHWW
jgi:5-hydroxyisourate hydrolase-like protein (transthyretin family)